jgi:hypothetical protein
MYFGIFSNYNINILTEQDRNFEMLVMKLEEYKLNAAIKFKYICNRQKSRKYFT